MLKQELYSRIGNLHLFSQLIKTVQNNFSFEKLSPTQSYQFDYLLDFTYAKIEDFIKRCNDCQLVKKINLESEPDKDLSKALKFEKFVLSKTYSFPFDYLLFGGIYLIISLDSLYEYRNEANFKLIQKDLDNLIIALERLVEFILDGGGNGSLLLENEVSILLTDEILSEFEDSNFYLFPLLPNRYDIEKFKIKFRQFILNNNQY